MASRLFAQVHLSPRVTPETSSSVAMCFIATQAIGPAVFTYIEPFKVSDLCSDNNGGSCTLRSQPHQKNPFLAIIQK